ncbi:MAG TPA: radical SAM protein, partial [Clostridia bacterium]|nr:radical SAM protein [Clostridia bacterium]
SFARLLSEIDKLEGKFRVRFMTSHPKDLNAEIADIIAKSEKICKNIHLPAQSGSDKVLKDMNRRYTSAHYLSLLDMIREKMPDCGITSDIMIGFPTESEEDFEDTLNLVKSAKYSAAFTFVYSPRQGTSAAKMEQLTNEVKKARIMRLVALQNSITRQQSKKYLGEAFEVLVEDKSDKNEDCVCGRTDSGRLVTFKGAADLIGEFVMIKINEAHTASLFGEILGDEK